MFLIINAMYCHPSLSINSYSCTQKWNNNRLQWWSIPGSLKFFGVILRHIPIWSSSEAPFRKHLQTKFLNDRSLKFISSIKEKREYENKTTILIFSSRLLKSSEKLFYCFILICFIQLNEEFPLVISACTSGTVLEILTL